MLILSLDTTTRGGSCAVARGDQILREAPTDPSRDHAAQLPGALDTLLRAVDLAIADVDVFAVATGPGSFTGLRIGIASMQGLALATGKPLIGVSALDALAHAGRALSGPPGQPEGVAPRRIATWMDAWRGEVYAALYENGRAVEPPTVASPDALLQQLHSLDLLNPPHPPHGGAVVFVGDGAVTFRAMIRARHGFIVEPTPLLAGAIARLAHARAQAGEAPPPDAIRPLYVRRPDAELARARTC
jgi:tRNA threonylcarbamoyladenosine biosynthesis protein TsaB